ncbi:hypothetical protein HK405_014492 [Cladochytrium tenue]|nr:hypothetical protein HK405_014492 [Cladochytrium tenue]
MATPTPAGASLSSTKAPSSSPAQSSSAAFSLNLLQVSVSSLLHTAGFERASASTTHLLADVAARYLEHIAGRAAGLAAHQCRSEANFEDAVLALSDSHVDLEAFYEYCRFVSTNEKLQHQPIERDKELSAEGSILDGIKLAALESSTDVVATSYKGLHRPEELECATSETAAIQERLRMGINRDAVAADPDLPSGPSRVATTISSLSKRVRLYVEPVTPPNSASPGSSDRSMAVLSDYVQASLARELALQSPLPAAPISALQPSDVKIPKTLIPSSSLRLLFEKVTRDHYASIPPPDSLYGFPGSLGLLGELAAAGTSRLKDLFHTPDKANFVRAESPIKELAPNLNLEVQSVVDNPVGFAGFPLVNPPPFVPRSNEAATRESHYDVLNTRAGSTSLEPSSHIEVHELDNLAMEIQGLSGENLLEATTTAPLPRPYSPVQLTAPEHTPFRPVPSGSALTRASSSSEMSPPSSSSQPPDPSQNLPVLGIKTPAGPSKIKLKLSLRPQHDTQKANTPQAESRGGSLAPKSEPLNISTTLPNMGPAKLSVLPREEPTASPPRNKEIYVALSANSVANPHRKSMAHNSAALQSKAEPLCVQGQPTDRTIPDAAPPMQPPALPSEDADSDVINCICSTPHVDYGRFMIACDVCGVWYHGACVNVFDPPEFWRCLRCGPT